MSETSLIFQRSIVNISMAGHHLCGCAALFFFLAFSSPLVTARLGGRSCHTSFFFPDLHINDNNDLRLLTDIDGASANFKILSVAGSGHGWIEGHRPPFSLIQVRLLNLHRQSLFQPGFAHALDLSDDQRDTLPVEKLSVVEQPTLDQFLPTWSFSTSNPHQPITWINIQSRRGMWRHEFPDRADKKPFHLEDDEWQSTMNELWRMTFGLLFGAATGMLFAATVALVWSLFRRMCARSQDDDEDVGFLYGYQELLASEKEDSKGDEKEFTKEGAIVVQNM